MRRVSADEPTRRGRVLCCAAAMLAGLAVAGCGAAHWPLQSSTAAPGSPVPASAIHRLTVIADRAIKMTAGRGVAWASAVVTTHEKALTSATPGDTEPFGGKTIVYLVTIKGHFTAVAFTGPPGAHAPTGTYLSMVIDAKTFQGLDFGLGPKPHPVAPASLGPLTYLKVGATAQPTPGRAGTAHRGPPATIMIDPQIGETFAPAPSSAAPKLTAQQAWQHYARLSGSKRTTIPSFVTVRLGLLTLPVGPAFLPGTSRLPKSHGEAYTALNQLVYGFSTPSGCVYVGGPGMRPPPPTPCIEWTFLNANTGKQIDTTWQKIGQRHVWTNSNAP